MTGRGDPNGPTHPWRLVDTHCHLDRMTNAGEVATRALELDVAVLCTTVGPDDAQGAQTAFAGYPNVRVAVGLHPWWVADGAEGERQGARAAEMVASWDLVGEVGLDLSPAHAGTRNAQLSAFDRIVSACAGHPREGRVLSIHAVRATSEALDILERHRLPGNATCIFHWFSGTSADFDRLRRLGCHISVSERMLASKRGREYARQMPLDRLHLETDAPPRLDEAYPAEELDRSLSRSLDALARIRGAEREELAAHIAQTSSRLLGM